MIKYDNIEELIINKQHKLGSHEKQPLLFSLVHIILCYVYKILVTQIKPVF